MSAMSCLTVCSTSADAVVSVGEFCDLLGRLLVSASACLRAYQSASMQAWHTGIVASGTCGTSHTRGSRIERSSVVR